MMIQTFNERMIWKEFLQVFLSLLSPSLSPEVMKRRTGDSSWGSQSIGSPSHASSAEGNSLSPLITGRKWPGKKLSPACVWLRWWFAVFLQVLWFLGEVSPHCASSAWLLWPPWWTLPSLPHARNTSPSPQREALKWMNLRSAEGLVHKRLLAAGLLGSEGSTAGPGWRSWGRQSIGDAGMTGASADLPLWPGSANCIEQSGWLMGWAVCSLTVGVIHLIVFWGLYCSGAVMSLKALYHYGGGSCGAPEKKIPELRT